MEVKSTNGDTHLGGDDWDDKIINWLVEGFKNENGVDLSKDAMALTRLKEAAEKAKIDLSSVMETEINLPYIMPVDGVPKHLVKSLTRAKFESLAADLFERTLGPLKQAIADAGVKASDIAEVVLEKALQLARDHLAARGIQGGVQHAHAGTQALVARRNQHDRGIHGDARQGHHPV